VDTLPKMLSDINAACQDVAIDTVSAFADAAPPGLMHKASDSLFAPIVDKTFGTKPALMVKGQGLLLKLMEVDDATAAVVYLLSRLGDKKPKIVLGCLEVITQALTAYGAKSVPVKEILSALGAVFNSSNAESRDQAMSLAVELQRWVGKASQKVVESMRPAQKEVFEEAVKANAGQKPPQPTSYLRKDKPAESSSRSSISRDADDDIKEDRPAAASSSSAIDERDYVEDVDLMKKLKGTSYSTLVVSEKWDEQAAALQLIIEAIGSTPKLKKGCDITDVITACKNFLRAGHINVQVTVLRVLALLCDGLR
jgi:cytoskeleton-associated protein 5